MNERPLMNGAGVAKTVEAAERHLPHAGPAIVLGTFARNGGVIHGPFLASAASTFPSYWDAPGPNLDEWWTTIGKVANMARPMSTPVWVSVTSNVSAEFKTLTQASLEAGADRVELNVGYFLSETHPPRAPSFTVGLLREILEASASASSGRKVLVVKLPVIPNADDLSEVVECLNRFDDIAAIVSTHPTPTQTRMVDQTEQTAKATSITQLAALSELARADIELIGNGSIRNGKDLFDYMTIDRVTRCQSTSAVLDEGPEAISRITNEYLLLAHSTHIGE